MEWMTGNRKLFGVLVSLLSLFLAVYTYVLAAQLLDISQIT